MYVGVSKEKGLGSLMSSDPRHSEELFFSVGNIERGQGPVYYAGNEYPLFSEIPLEDVRQALKEFVESGGLRPACVEWAELKWDD
jgi:hypothetical protein